ncbi:MAG: hypothetical protein ACFHX7_21845 [Pseudomonadota bacterium]
MTVHRLEVYVDSYKSKPFIKDFDNTIDLSFRDERQLEDWITLLKGVPVSIDRQLRIEDIKHHFLDTMEHLVHATSVRVSIID